MPQEKNDHVETELEGRILDSIQRVGWDWRFTNLWFPFVERKILGLDVNASDHDIQAAVVSLIRESKLIHVDPEGWRIPNFSPAPDIRGPVLPAPGYLALAYRMPTVQFGPIETALAKEKKTDESRGVISDAGHDIKKANWADAELSELEAYIVHSIDHVGWYAYLWFPVVARGALNFGSDDREEDVHAAILSLIERGGLVLKQESVDDTPECCPAPGILDAAERKMREIRSRLPPPFPDRFSERFHIIAHGDKFDVDAFMATSSLRPDYVWRRGPSGTTGIELFLGDGRQIRLIDQEDAAVTYLNTHKEELKALACFPGVDTFILGLVWICSPEQIVFSVGPSAELMQLALDIGIFPLYYCTIDGRGVPHLGEK
jgi:hypothetical protein